MTLLGLLTIFIQLFFKNDFLLLFYLFYFFCILVVFIISFNYNRRLKTLSDFSNQNLLILFILQSLCFTLNQRFITIFNHMLCANPSQMFCHFLPSPSMLYYPLDHFIILKNCPFLSCFCRIKVVIHCYLHCFGVRKYFLFESRNIFLAI